MSLEEFQYLITKERISSIERRQREAQQIKEKPRLGCHYIQGSKNESVQFYWNIKENLVVFSNIEVTRDLVR